MLKDCESDSVLLFFSLFAFFRFLCYRHEVAAGEELNKHSCFRSDPIVCFMLVLFSPCNHVQFMRQ